MTFESYESRLNAALRRLIATNLIGVLFTDLSGNIITADESFLALTGYTRNTLPASVRALTAPDTMPQHMTLIPDGRRAVNSSDGSQFALWDLTAQAPPIRRQRNDW